MTCYAALLSSNCYLALNTHMDHDPKRTTPIGLSRYARDFLDAALSADKDIGMRPGYEIHAPVPVMYLVGHAIELSLKSFLAFKRVSLKELSSRKYGHDLEACFKKARECGLLSIATFEGSDIEGMKVLNKLYSTKQLNYIITGAKTFPVFGPIRSFAETLLGAIGPHVGYK